MVAGVYPNLFAPWQRRKREEGQRCQSRKSVVSSSSLYLFSFASRTTVHFGHKETTMEEYSLTLGAHLLLWVFPLALVVLVVAENYLDRRNRGPER
jgi:hypothetical protein